MSDDQKQRTTDDDTEGQIAHRKAIPTPGDDDTEGQIAHRK